MTIVTCRRVIVIEMLNIVTNAALERFIVMGMGNSVTIGAMNRYSRRRIFVHQG